MRNVDDTANEINQLRHENEYLRGLIRDEELVYVPVGEMVQWRLFSSSSSVADHALLYRGVYRDLGVQLEIITPVRKGCYYSFGNSKAYFFADGDKRTFRTEEELCAVIDAMSEIDRLRGRRKGTK